jgi:putative isomerase
LNSESSSQSFFHGTYPASLVGLARRAAEVFGRSGLILGIGMAIFSGTVGSVVAEAVSPPYAYSGDLSVDISKVPFSRFGSYISISNMKEFQSSLKRDAVFLRDLHQGGEQSFRLEVIRDGRTVPFTVVAEPTLLSLVTDGGTIEVCYQGPDRLRIHGKGAGLRLVADNSSWAVQQGSSKWEVNNSATKYMLWSLEGNLQVDAPWNGTGSDHVLVTFGSASGSNQFEAEVDAYTSVWAPHDREGSFDDAHSKEKSLYGEWLRKMPQVGVEFGKGAELAAYVNWESVVQPDGNLKRPSMLMSKNWMNALWSWDQSFNAMALTLGDPKLAWDQFMLPIDMQSRYGAFPDKWDADNAVWEYSKPPVHGWVLAWMIHQYPQFGDRAHLLQIYEPLVRWTNWYFKYRDTNHNGFPEYRHGDESGWDNSTVMLSGSPVESPDLDAYLIVQMDTLAKLAHKLGKEKEAVEWQTRSSQLLAATIKRFWTGDRFVAFRVSDGGQIESESLELSMPLILGSRLPATIQDKIVANLTEAGRYRTDHGLASEAIKSKYYTPDGYWRGPIWAPTTMILAESLDEIGKRQMADSLREEFCRMAQAEGMSENYDALTGKALRDPAYTWASSVYLIFAHELYTRHKP